jgi:hypothetical protein
MKQFIWKTFKTVAENRLKEILGKSFDRLLKYKENDDIKSFKDTLEIIIESNENIKQNLENLKNGTFITQNNLGNGDNIVGNKTVNYNNPHKMKPNFKNKLLYKNSLFLDDIEINNEPLNENYYNNVHKLLKTINTLYKDAITHLLPNKTNLMLRALDAPTNPDSCKRDRQMIIDNKEEIKRLLLEYLENPSSK